MKISVNKQILLDVLSKVQNVINPRATLPILSNILIESCYLGDHVPLGKLGRFSLQVYYRAAPGNDDSKPQPFAQVSFKCDNSVKKMLTDRMRKGGDRWKTK